MSGQFEQTDVFRAGADGVDTYRIPSLILAPGGTLLAFCEARKQSARDAGPTDMVLKRSTDGGRTWGPMRRLVPGEGDEAIMNPAPSIDGDTVVLFCINAHKLEHGRHRQLVLASRDDGETWSEPRDITDRIIDGDDTFVPGPGVSIRTRAGRLVVPGYTNIYTAGRERVTSHSRVVYSDDHGQTWQLGQPVPYEGSNESQVVELSDGSLLINCRVQAKDPDKHPGCRVMSVSRDGGETWGEPRLAPELREAPCQGGFVRYDPVGHGRRLLFSNPDATLAEPATTRHRMTVRLSDDEGASWPVAGLVHAGPSVYSCPARLPDGTIGLLYESGETTRHERIRFARFDLDWLTERRDHLDARSATAP